MGEDSEQIDETEEPAAVLRFNTRLRGVSEGERFTGEPITSSDLFLGSVSWGRLGGSWFKAGACFAATCFCSPDIVLYFLSQSLQSDSDPMFRMSSLVLSIESFLAKPSLSSVFFRICSKNQRGAFNPAIVFEPWSWTTLVEI